MFIAFRFTWHCTESINVESIRVLFKKKRCPLQDEMEEAKPVAAGTASSASLSGEGAASARRRW